MPSLEETVTVQALARRGDADKSRQPAPERERDPLPMLLTVIQAASLLGVGRSTAYELIATRQLEVVHIGRCVRVPADAVEDFVQRLRQGRASKPYNR